jgi:hypothetical protein
MHFPFGKGEFILALNFLVFLVVLQKKENDQLNNEESVIVKAKN